MENIQEVQSSDAGHISREQKFTYREALQNSQPNTDVKLVNMQFNQLE